MGLDMYLHRNLDQKALLNDKKVLFNIAPAIEADQNDEKATALNNTIIEALTPADDIYNTTVSVLAGYWRKANAIHNWILNKTNEDDNCQNIDISKETLQAFLVDINHVLISRESESEDEAESIALETIPPTEGFFFGDSDIDDYYYESLVDTKHIIEKELRLEKELTEAGFEFAISWTYRASW